jgi:hydrogenase 3 maturation protease
MTESASQAELEGKLGKLVKGKKLVVACVGNPIRGDDGAAQLLFRKLKHQALRLSVMNCGTNPQDYIDEIVRLQPGVMIFVNALDRSLRPGTTVLEELESTSLTGSSLIAHKFPLAWIASLIEMMTDEGNSTHTVLVGIQVGSTRGRITPPVRKSVAILLRVFHKLDAVAKPLEPSRIC